MCFAPGWMLALRSSFPPPALRCARGVGQAGRRQLHGDGRVRAIRQTAQGGAGPTDGGRGALRPNGYDGFVVIDGLVFAGCLVGSPIDVPTMANLENRYDLTSVVDRVDGAVVTLPHAKPII